MIERKKFANRYNMNLRNAPTKGNEVSDDMGMQEGYEGDGVCVRWICKEEFRRVCLDGTK